MSLEDTENFAAGDALDLSNAMRVTKNNADLRWSQTLLRELADILLHLNQQSDVNQGIQDRTAMHTIEMI